MKRILTLVIGFVIVGQLSAQNLYRFDYQGSEFNDISANYVKKHFLGSDIANKMQVLKETYTYVTINELNQAETTTIEKPSIFSSVKKADKFVKKQMKSGALTEEEARTVMDKILLVAINIRHQNTEDLEQELWKMKDPKQITSLFVDRIAMNM